MRVDPTAGTGGEVMSDAGTIIGVHFPGRRLRLFTFCDDQRSECLAGRRKTPAWARFFAVRQCDWDLGGGWSCGWALIDG